MKSYKREDSLERCLPDEKPWDTILVDGHGPMQVASIQGATYAYYFRSRKGGGIIVKGASAHSQFPWLLEQVIIEVTANRGFKPKRLLSDNAGEFIGNVAEKVMTAYNIYFDPIPPSSSQSGGLWEKCVGDVKRRSTTNMIQAPWCPPTMWLLCDQYAALQMYCIEYSPNPNGESPCEVERGIAPNWEDWHFKPWFCPIQFKDTGLVRSAHAERPLNPARDEITIDGYFAGKAGIAIMVYQKSLNRVIKVPFQACEFHESDFIRPLPTAADFETAWETELPPSVLPSITQLRKMPEGEGKSDSWSCEQQQDFPLPGGENHVLGEYSGESNDAESQKDSELSVGNFCPVNAHEEPSHSTPESHVNESVGNEEKYGQNDSEADKPENPLDNNTN